MLPRPLTPPFSMPGRLEMLNGDDGDGAKLFKKKKKKKNKNGKSGMAVRQACRGGVPGPVL